MDKSEGPLSLLKTFFPEKYDEVMELLKTIPFSYGRIETHEETNETMKKLYYKLFS